MSARVDRRAPLPAARRRGAGNMLLGVFIGVVIGLAIAAGVAFYLLKAGNPYQLAPGGTREAARDAGRDLASRAGRADAAQPDKPRFDFYKILPGGEEPKVQPRAPDHPVGDRATVERSTAPERPADAKTATEKAEPADAKAAERFWLQAGSFATEGDAENLKARLALSGWEASVQAANVPEKGVRYRVRMGPYQNTDEVNRIKNELSRRGFDVAVVKF